MYFYFAKRWFSNVKIYVIFVGQTPCPIWCVGTNAGTVLMFQLKIPADDKREGEAVTCKIGKNSHTLRFKLNYNAIQSHHSKFTCYYF